jgi:hypothetical protein
LTVLRAFHVAGRPSATVPLGSFEDWSTWIRDALIWLGQPDPCATMEKIKAASSRRLVFILVRLLLLLGQTPP